MNPKTRLQELQQELSDQMAILEDAGERWLEARAAGRTPEKIDAEVEAATRATRRIEEKIRREQKRRNI